MWTLGVIGPAVNLPVTTPFLHHHCRHSQASRIFGPRAFLPDVRVLFTTLKTRSHCVAIGTAPVANHTVIVEASTLAAVMPNRRDLRIFAEVGSVVDNKELLESSFAENSFSVSFLSGGVEEEGIS
jgi:hypothetical protein